MQLEHLVKELIEQVLEEARSAGCSQVWRVRLVLGALAVVSPEELSGCFQSLARDPALAGTSIHVEVRPALARCKTCDLEFEPEADPWPCPRCAGFSWVLLEGDELYVEGIEPEPEG
jgi:hydrogenase nickel incorporation protein HypA/HybF